MLIITKMRMTPPTDPHTMAISSVVDKPVSSVGAIGEGVAMLTGEMYNKVKPRDWKRASELADSRADSTSTAGMMLLPPGAKT
jgi:hypothetical protein